MPPTQPANRVRLAELMDERRKELRLEWVDVAKAGSIGGRTIHNVRTGIQNISDVTKAGLEDGLRWQRGSVDLILGDGDPVPLPPGTPPPAARSPAAGADSQWLPPPGADNDVQVRPYYDAIIEKILDLADQGITNPSGEQLFGAGTEDAGTWDRRAALYTRTERAWMIAEFRWREEAARRSRAGTGLRRAALTRT